MYFDWTYVVLVLPAVIFSLWANWLVKSTFKKYSSLPVSMTGRQAAESVLRWNDVTGVSVVETGGTLTDHFDPRSNVISLSAEVCNVNTVAAAGVAAHEAGHAVQTARGYFPSRLRAVIVPVTNVGSRLALPLIILGIVLSSLGQIFITIAYIGLACYALCALFQVVTLPTEFNASSRAMAALRESGRMNEEELSGARRVLTAAALTYVAALAVTLMQLLRLMLLVSGGRRRN